MSPTDHPDDPLDDTNLPSLRVPPSVAPNGNRPAATEPPEDEPSVPAQLPVVLKKKDRNVKSWVQGYAAKGWALTPLLPETKIAYELEWQTRPLSIAQVNARTWDANVALVLGLSKKIDIDLDVPEAITVALRFLPPTPVIWGRKTAPCSHYLYSITAVTVAYAAFRDVEGVMLLEFRTGEHYSMIPPSVHDETRELVTWRSTWDNPAEYPDVVLFRATRAVAITVLMSRHWPAEGSRHHAALALAGVLLRRGLSGPLVEQIVLEAATLAGDIDELEDRRKAVEDTLAELEIGGHVTGAPTLETCLRDGQRAVARLLDPKWWPLEAAERPERRRPPPPPGGEHPGGGRPGGGRPGGGRPASEHPDPPEAGEPGAPSSASSSSESELPQPVPSSLLPVPAFSLDLLPEAFRPWVADIAERVQCPVDYVAIAAMVTVASVIGRQVGIEPRRKDDWLVVPNLFGQAIGPPGVMKTPAMRQAMRPLRILVAKADAKYKEEMKAFGFEEVKNEAKRKVLTEQIKEGVRKGVDVDSLKAGFADLELEPPVRRRYETNDVTIEKMGDLMNKNPNGILLFEDELAGWHRTCDREGHQGDRTFWDRAWDGDQSAAIDRVGRGELFVEACTGSILGGIQPGPLIALLRDVFANGRTNDGLPQRFQLSVWPDIASEWRDVQRWPDTTARQTVVRIFEQLAELNVERFGARLPGPGDEKAIPSLRFTEEAQAGWDSWYKEHQERLRRPSEEHPIVANHLAKFSSMVASLALVGHLIDCVALDQRGALDPQRTAGVSGPAFERAVGWAVYLEEHARRMYECVTNAGRIATALLAAKIRVGRIASPFTVNQVVHKDWSGLSEPAVIEAGLERLEELRWLRREERLPTPKGGRYSVLFHVHPAITKTFP